MVALAAREALAEAGMTLKDVDGIFVNYMGEEGSVQVGEYLGIQPRYGDSLRHGRRLVRGVRAPRDAGGRRRALRGRADRLRVAPAEPPQPQHGGRRRRQPRGPVRGAVRAAARDRPLRADREPPYAPVRHDAGAAGRGRRHRPRVGADEPEGVVARSAHGGRRARVAADQRSVAQARLLPAHRRRRRGRRHHRRARQGRGEAPDQGARRRREPHALAHQPDARLHRDAAPASPAARPSRGPGSPPPTSTSSSRTTTSPAR